MAIQSIKRLEDYVPAGGAAGNNTEIQYNNSGTLGASSNLTFDGSNLALGNPAPNSYIDSVHGLIVGDTTDATNEIVIATNTTGIGEINFTDTANTTNQGGIRFDHSTGLMQMMFSGSVGLTISETLKLFTGNATSNVMADAHSLTLDQGAGDAEILAFKSSDVAHGMTVQAETDTYGKIQKSSDTTGGLLIRGLSEATISVNTQAMGTTANTSKSTTGVGFTDLDNYIKSGTSATTPSADANLLSVRSGGLVRFIVDAEGDYHYDGTGSAFDTYADAELTRALTHVMSDPAQVVRSRWDDDVRYNEDDLVKAKLIGYVSPEEKAQGVRPLVNGAQLQRLHHGAIWQLHQQIRNQEEEIKALREQRENDIAELRGQIIRLQEKN